MFKRPTFGIKCAILLAVLTFAAACAVAQQPKLPDAPTPQNNAPAPNVNVPTEGAPDDQGSSSSSGNPEVPPNTRNGAQQSPATNPEAPPPGSEQIKTVPAGSVSNGGESGRDELFRLQKTVTFVTVPVTVKDTEGKLIDGLLESDFSIYEDGIKQQLKLFTSDPFPLSAALIIDQGMSDQTLRKVNQTYSALGGSFGPFDEVAVFTYGNSVNKRQDFGNTTKMEIALQRIRDERGQNPGARVVGGPFGSGPQTNSKPMPGDSPQQLATRESHVLNDAILMAAQELAHRPREPQNHFRHQRWTGAGQPRQL